MATKPRVYLDAGPFIDAAKFDASASGDSKVHPNPTRETDVRALKQLLKAGRDGAIEIFTSTVTIAECRHLGEGYISEEGKRLFRAMLLSGDPVQLVQPTVFIVEDARDLTWKHHIPSIRGLDAIHIASAIDRQCSEFITIDKNDLLNHAGEFAKLGLRVIRPSDTSLLPDEYKQTDLFK
jgi:predicted nucleic acid-binding protein